MRQSNNGAASMKNIAIVQIAVRSVVGMTSDWIVCVPSLCLCVVVAVVWVGRVGAEAGPDPSFLDSWAPLEYREYLHLFQSIRA